IDVEALRLILANWDRIKQHLVQEKDNSSRCYDGLHFRMDWFADYLERLGLHNMWPRTTGGALSTSGNAFEEMEEARPELRELKELKAAIDKLKLNSMTVGADGRNRTLLSAFKSKTGRNQPSNAKFVYLSDTWLRSLIQPPPGTFVAYADW